MMDGWVDGWKDGWMREREIDNDIETKVADVYYYYISVSVC